MPKNQKYVQKVYSNPPVMPKILKSFLNSPKMPKNSQLVSKDLKILRNFPILKIKCLQIFSSTYYFSTRDIRSNIELSMYYPTQIRGLPFLCGMILGSFIDTEKINIVSDQVRIFMANFKLLLSNLILDNEIDHAIDADHFIDLHLNLSDSIGIF